MRVLCSVKAGNGSQGGYELRGDNRKLLSNKDPECIVAGGADTGKTVACCIKAHLICLRVPKVQGAFVRKTYASMPGSVLQTFARIIEGSGVRVLGAAYPVRYVYPNGSTIWVGGMDTPERVLSSERDFIYCNQAEQLTLHDWETLATRCSGRAAVVKYPQMFGDCNPGGSKHWIRERAKSGKLTLLVARHVDNPTIYDGSGVLTESGKRRLAMLENLSGVRRKRLLEGQWATAEGAVYENFDSKPGGPHVHPRDPREMKRFFLAMDEGGTNPQVNLLIGEDGDGRWHVFREFYVTQRNESEIVAQAKCWYEDVRTKGIVRVPYRLDNVSGEYNLEGAGLDLPDATGPVRCELVAVDEAAAGLIRSLQSIGLNAKGGKGGLLNGIHKIEDKIKIQPFDNKARLTVDPSCVNTINEFESHVWKPEKDVPVDKDNHALSALRYLYDALQVPSGAFAPGDVAKSWTPVRGGFGGGLGNWLEPSRDRLEIGERLEAHWERIEF